MPVGDGATSTKIRAETENAVTYKDSVTGESTGVIKLARVVLAADHASTETDKCVMDPHGPTRVATVTAVSDITDATTPGGLQYETHASEGGRVATDYTV